MSDQKPVSTSLSLIGSLKKFIQMESSSGILLACCTIFAMTIANSRFGILYSDFFETKVFGLTLLHWINDGLMTVFFFVVGLEIKREIIAGELSTIKKASLPIAAALGGIVVPASIYAYMNNGLDSLNGWAIPMATDIAFALGVLMLFGSRVPLALKIFLLALAIVDDLVAVLVIALFYTNEIRATGLIGLGIAMSATLLAKHLQVRSYLLYVILGTIAWGSTLYSGVHATIAGVLLGLVTPHTFPTARNGSNTYSPTNDLIHYLHPIVSFGIMPIFALANSGISLIGADFAKIVNHPVFSGVTFGLFFGKPIGITLFSLASIGLGLAAMPKGLNWKHIVGVSLLGGIGFTMALFISGLSLNDELQTYSKVGILTGSFFAGITGVIWLQFAFKKKSD